jgi:hypothetical protein
VGPVPDLHGNIAHCIRFCWVGEGGGGRATYHDIRIIFRKGEGSPFTSHKNYTVLKGFVLPTAIAETLSCKPLSIVAVGIKHLYVT